MKKIVIYPGRFQPMLPHHAGVYQHLQSQFPGADVYISTSDKVEGTKSAFNFNEKVAIMTKMHGIPADKIIQAKVPYLIDSYKTQFDQVNNMVIFAVGSKDADRFPMNNIDDSTGLDMTVRGEARPKYYQMINTLEQHPPLPMSERGYVYNAPTIDNGGEVASASAFRDAFISAPDEGSRKEIFTRYMGEYNNNIYALFVNKLMDNKMKTENAYNIDVIKYLSGMLNEAPINFDDYDADREEAGDDEDTDGLRPGFKQDSMVNQLGKISDSGEAAKDADQLMKKGKEFNVSSSVTTDDGETFNLTPAEADALLQMFNMLSAQRAGEEESPREKFTRSIQASKGLESMLSFAKSKGLVREEAKTLPQVDLGEIRDDYAVEGDLEEGRVKDVLIDAQQMSREEFNAKYNGEWNYDEILADYPVEETTTVSEDEAPTHYDLEQAYNRIYQMTDEMGDEALEQMNHYAPKFSDALERAEGNIDDIPSEEIPTYMAELDNAAFEMGAPEFVPFEAVEEGKLPAGLQAYQDKKNGKKDDDADKDEDKEVDEDKDEEVDENAQFESSLAQLKKLSGI
jgi:hypothetical protein